MYIYKIHIFIFAVSLLNLTNNLYVLSDLMFHLHFTALEFLSMVNDAIPLLLYSRVDLVCGKDTALDAFNVAKTANLGIYTGREYITFLEYKP